MDTKGSFHRARWRAAWRLLLLIVVVVAIVVAVTAAGMAAMALLLSAAGPRIVQSSPAWSPGGGWIAFGRQ